MRLAPIHPKAPAFIAQCVKCSGSVDSDTGFADLDGEAFVSYVCAACAPDVPSDWTIPGTGARCRHDDCRVPVGDAGASCGHHESDKPAK